MFPGSFKGVSPHRQCHRPSLTACLSGAPNETLLLFLGILVSSLTSASHHGTKLSFQSSSCRTTTWRFPCTFGPSQPNPTQLPLSTSQSSLIKPTQAPFPHTVAETSQAKPSDLSLVLTPQSTEARHPPASCSTALAPTAEQASPHTGWLVRAVYLHPPAERLNVRLNNRQKWPASGRKKWIEIIFKGFYSGEGTYVWTSEVCRVLICICCLFCVRVSTWLSCAGSVITLHHTYIRFQISKSNTLFIRLTEKA